MGRKDDPRPEFVKGGEMDEEIKGLELKMEDTFVSFGSELKDLGDGKFGGYLVRFGNKEDTDLEGEYFNRDTDFDMEFPAKSSVYFQHGMDPAMKRKVMGKADLKVDEFGVWAEVILAERDEYEKFIAELAKQGKLGWSSGTAGHLVERVQMGKSVWIKRWPLGLDASLTHTPAEPRNEVVPLKSLEVDTPEAVEPEAGEAGEASSAVLEAEKGVSEVVEKIILEKEFEMDEDTKKEIAEMISESVKAAMPAPVQEPAKGAELVVPNLKKVTELGFEKDAVKGFCNYIATGKPNGALIPVAYDFRNPVEGKAAMQGQTDSEGGYAVPDELDTRIIAKMGEISVIRAIGVFSRPSNSDRILVSAEDTAATKFVVTAEEAAVDENEPTLTQPAAPIYDFTKLIKLSRALEADAPGLDTYLVNVFARAKAAAENYYFVASGTGTAMPQSMLAGSTAGTTTAGATAITAAEMLGLIYAIKDGYASNLFLCMKRATLGYIRALSGNPFSFVPTPTGEGNGVNPGTIHGVPVYCTAEMPAMTATLKSVLLGNADFYLYSEREPLVVERNPWLYQGTRQVGLFSWFRAGGAVAQAEAFYHLPQHA
jgi:HK97 family phage major capsid protein